MKQSTPVRQVSVTEVEQLFEFVRSKFVRQKDLQAELVDHLACSIEELWQEDAELSFELALSKVYARFPITGFAKFVEEKTNALYWYWFVRFWQYLKQFFTWPKVILTLALCVGIYTAYHGSTFFMDHSSLLLFGVAMLMLLVQIIRGKFVDWKKRKEYLIFNMYTGVWFTFFGVGFQVLAQKFFFLNFDSGHTAIHSMPPEKLAYVLPIFAFLDTLIVISGYAVLFVFPKMLEGEMAKYEKSSMLVGSEVTRLW